MFRKITILSATLLVVLFFSVSVFANTEHFGQFNRHHNNRNPELNRRACQTEGRAIVDVIQKVKNDTDSGFGANVYFPASANYWNVENYTRHITVWRDRDGNPDTWCATVEYYNGRFDALYKQTGPAGTGTISAFVEGEMRGGYRAIITGAMLASPTWALSGNVGTFDYDCDFAGNCGPARVDWVAQYFDPSYGFDFKYWGWTYKAGSHGTWVNQCDSAEIPTNPACTGGSGNIL